ncbi:MAG: Hsp20/alpha crystallin family protein [Anaerolineae bacterium]|nr:MAG: Hsp20/alpha crystallin family protein [Anaerolineae bacterium]
MEERRGESGHGGFGRFKSQMDRMFGDMVVSGRWVGPCRYQTWHPPTDVYETDQQYVVQVEIAGMKESDFSISLSERTLVVAGFRDDPAAKQACHQIEIGYGEFRSEVALPGPVNDGGVEATYEDGFLRIVLPKRPVRKVPVVGP